MKNLFFIFLITGTLLSASNLKGQSEWKAPPSASIIENPVPEDGNAIAKGKELFSTICFVCHGDQGKGNGFNAGSLERPPADLTSHQVQKQSDGELFWKISEGNPPMLSFKQSLSEEQRWQLIRYIRELARKYPPETDNTIVEAKGVKENSVVKPMTVEAPVRAKEIEETAAVVIEPKPILPNPEEASLAPQPSSKKTTASRNLTLSQYIFLGVISFVVLICIYLLQVLSEMTK